MNKQEVDELRRAWLELDALMGDDVADDEPLAEVPDGEIAAYAIAADDPRVTRVREMVQARLDEKWRELLMEARDRRAARPIRVVPASPQRGREELLGRLGELRAKYPALALHHRDLGEMSDEMLGALVDDIEAVIARGDE